MELNFEFSWYSTVLIPLLIMLAKIVEVSLCTVRILFISRGLRLLAPLVGFFEIIIWLLAVSAVMKNLGNIPNYVGYAAGFVMGNFIGMFIENKISIGHILIRVITRRDAVELTKFLIEAGYNITHVNALGARERVKIIFTVVKRRQLPEVVAIIKRFNPNAFYTVEDMRFVSEVALPAPGSPKGIFRFRKSK